MTAQSNPNAGAGVRGFQEPESSATEFARIAFVVRAMLNKVATVTLVKVMGVTNVGAAAPVGFVDLMPLVNQIDGAGNATPHGTIYKCPYLRVQGGANAVIIDPQVGDLGIALFADHDISSVVANKGQANPGSRRRFDMADALYIGGVLNGTPTQFVRFAADGVHIDSPVGVTIDTPLLTVTGAIVAQSTIVATGDVTGAGTSLHTHTHGGVQPGGGNTGGPN